MNGLMPVTIKSLLFGNVNYDVEINKRVFDAAHRFILDTRTFV